MAISVIPTAIGYIVKELTGSQLLATVAGVGLGFALGNEASEGNNMVTSSQTVTSGTTVNGVSFGGPGVPEPPAAIVAKAWKTKAFSKTAGEYWVYFWRLTDGRMMCWNAAKRQVSIWRPKKNVVISTDPRMSQIKRLERTYHKTITKMARKSNDLVLQKTVDNLRKRIAIMEAKKRK